MESSSHDVVSYCGTVMKPAGMTELWIHLDGFKAPRRIEAIVLDDRDNPLETLIGWRTLQRWGCIPEHFPLPPGKLIRQVYSKQRNEPGSTEPEEEPRQKPLSKHEQVVKKCNDLKQRLMLKFQDVFKSELAPDDIINNEQPIRLDIDTESDIQPENVKTPISIPLHLR